MPDLRAYARDAATRAGIDPDRFVRQIQQESGFNPDAHNDGSGADGIAQIVVRWHPSMAGKTRDPEASLDYAAGLMRSHLDARGGDWALALSNYNAGPGATSQGLAGTLDGWPYPETVRYVATILGISRADASARLTGATPMPETLTYDPLTPPERQVQDWACSIRTATWMARSLGQTIDAGAMQDLMTPAYVTPKDGLLDGRGYGLAEVLRSVLPAGTSVSVHEAASWDQVMSWAGSGPIGMGSNKLYHWLAIREPDDEGALSGMNPAPKWQAVGDQITRAEFETWAPWNVVRVQLAEAQPEPAPPASNDDKLNGLISAVAYLADDVAAIDDRPVRLAEARRVREQFVGPRP